MHTLDVKHTQAPGSISQSWVKEPPKGKLYLGTALAAPFPCTFHPADGQRCPGGSGGPALALPWPCSSSTAAQEKFPLQETARHDEILTALLREIKPTRRCHISRIPSVAETGGLWKEATGAGVQGGQDGAVPSPLCPAP